MRCVGVLHASETALTLQRAKRTKEEILSLFPSFSRSMYVCLPVCLFVCMFFRLSVCLPVLYLRMTVSPRRSIIQAVNVVVFLVDVTMFAMR